jgi:hypothetical protein
MALKAERGVSLIELVVALSLSALVVGMGLALYKDVGRAASLAGAGRDEAFRTRVFFNSLCDNLMAGGGLLAVEPGRLRLLSSAGKPVDYRWEDSVLTVNGKSQAFRLAALEVVPWGPSLPSGEEWSRERTEFAEVDSLDDDRDGLVDFDELDRDRSGELDPYECRYVARVAVRMQTVHQGTLATLQGAVHPRNHAREWTEDALDALPGVGDFGR